MDSSCQVILCAQVSSGEFVTFSPLFINEENGYAVIVIAPEDFRGEKQPVSEFSC